MPADEHIRGKTAASSHGEPVPTVASREQQSREFLVVAIGASVGGLEAGQKLLDALPPEPGMAFIFVQHLDPNHESLLTGLLARHTIMSVLDAMDETPIEPNHLYVIRPGMDLTVADGRLIVAKASAVRAPKLPFDLLLESLAHAYGKRAACVVLSGTGADGSVGLRSIRANGGIVLAQEASEAEFDGMPESAVATGLVDNVLPAALIAQALVDHNARKRKAHPKNNQRPTDAPLNVIIELLRLETGHDFKHYKTGTLHRRIERRMGMGSTRFSDLSAYLAHLKTDKSEREALAKDLLIHVTCFFRDPKTFAFVNSKIIPEIVKSALPDRSIRVWVAGCSTGEEAYSIAMLFQEAIAAGKSRSKLQVFASDIDSDAITVARAGFYPHMIEADMTADRLAANFSREEGGYKVASDLRSAIVFTVHNILADPPFSQLDLVCCRNVLIYLSPDAQKRTIDLFHLALKDGGMLILGTAETVGKDEGSFVTVDRAQRVFRQMGRSRPGQFTFRNASAAGEAAYPAPDTGKDASRHSTVGEISRQIVLDEYAPASVVINQKSECLYTIGPVSHYLTLAQGAPTADILKLARKTLRTRLRAAIHHAIQTDSQVRRSGGRKGQDGSPTSFTIKVTPFMGEGEKLLLVCFLEKASSASLKDSTAPADLPQVERLERELEETRTELQDAIRNLEVFSEEQKAINDETISVNEEYQSTNEELLTSKEELQSLNEELTTLNSQLQETLKNQRTTSNDLQNILKSTDIATIFLDLDLNIRFFTPATRHLCNVIPTDIGRPLADLALLAVDTNLPADAASVLKKHDPVEREIEANDGIWYVRRVQPYRGENDGVEGVVVTFADVTTRRHTADSLVAAKLEAERATVAKSRFLAAASHDLRQPLQTLTLVQGLLARTVQDTTQEPLIKRFEDTLRGMTGMLNALLDINQIDAGIVRTNVVDFPIGEVLLRLGKELSYVAQAKGIELRVVDTSLCIQSDPKLVEQIVRNLAVNALKYTHSGKVLIGCRRHDDMVRIEVWDTGIGIAADEVQAIFDEYHQVGNSAHEPSKGFGLGLSIVRRLADLLGHEVHIHSKPEKGTGFAIDIPLAAASAHSESMPEAMASTIPHVAREDARAILIVEDDTDVRDMLTSLLKAAGHHVSSAADGKAAQKLVLHGAFAPDIMLADFNMPGSMDGVRTAKLLQERLDKPIPTIILTGDISANTLKLIAESGFAQLHKPVTVGKLTSVIQCMLQPQVGVILTEPASSGEAEGHAPPRVIHIVDDDANIRREIREVFEEDDFHVETYESCEDFLSSSKRSARECLLVDAYLPGMSGLGLLDALSERGDTLASIMITGESDVAMAIQAMKAGVSDFIEKPFGLTELRASVRSALKMSVDLDRLHSSQALAATQLAGLTQRQREIMDLVLAGHPSKNIAADLGISQRTVENHRAAIMTKTGSRSLPALARLAMTVDKSARVSVSPAR